MQDSEQRRNRPLAHLRVLELGSEIGVPLAARMLGDMGADVIKIERAPGDPLRSAGPFADSDETRTNGGLFDYVNSNKRSVLVDPGASTPTVRRLAEQADVILEDWGPGGLEAAGLAPDDLRAVKPDLCVIRLSDYGQSGPYADRVLAPGVTVQAAGGWVKPMGWPATDPVQIGGRFDEYVAAVYLATAAMTALNSTRHSGVGTDVDLSRMECCHATLTCPTVTRTVLDILGRGRSMEPLLGVKQCLDGWVGVNVLTQQQWAELCEMVDLPEYAEQREALRQGGPDRELFEARVEEWTGRQQVEDVVAACQKLRIPATPVHDGDLILRSAQWQQREFFSTRAGREQRFTHPSFPWRFADSPAETRRPAPWPGEQTDEIERLGWGVREREPAATDEPDGALPLHGLRIVDLGTFWAGAGCTCYLGAIGADVIKVESVQRPDGWRFNMASPKLGDQWWERGRFRAVNLNKRDVTLDLTRDEGRELLLSLIENADVVLENFAAPVMDKLGLGWDAIRAVNPRIIMVRMPGFGLEGPWRDYVGFGPSFIYASGHTALTGFEDGPPLNPGGHMDPLVAMAGAFATMVALEHRRTTGRGQLVELPQIEVGACLAPEPVIRYSMTGERMPRMGNRSATNAPQGVYRAGDGRWVALTVRSGADWRGLVKAAGDPDWAGEHDYDDDRTRKDHVDRLDEHIGGWLATLPSEQVVARLQEYVVPSAVVAVTDDYLQHPQLRHRGYYEVVDHPVVGEDTYPGWPMRFSPSPTRSHRAPAPTLGEHTEEVLRSLVGLDEAAITGLRERDVIGTEPLSAQRRR
jgi:crotonobetainyl-CoA:carnitine CoA-transferase CaiB-like acyl-CoA transferase